MEDFLQIERVEPGALWFEGGMVRSRSPKGGSAGPGGLSATVVLARVRGVWHLLEVDNVYP